MTINESSRTITLNKKEMTAARHFGSDDYKALQEARRDYPGFAVIAATRKATTQRETYKGLTYAYPITIGFLRGDKMIDYAKEVNDYGRSLAPVAKQAAREVFTRLLENGYDYEWLFFAIQNLGQRDVTRHRSLFFYKAFQEEVDAMVVANREAEEQRRQHSARICAAIEQQILQMNQQNIVKVTIHKNSRQRKSAAEWLAEIDQMEDE